MPKDQHIKKRLTLHAIRSVQRFKPGCIELIQLNSYQHHATNPQVINPRSEVLHRLQNGMHQDCTILTVIISHQYRHSQIPSD